MPYRGLLLAIYAALGVGVCLSDGGCSPVSKPSKADQAYFDAYSNETRTTIAWWKQQLDTAQLIRTARGSVDSAQPALAGAAATEREEALRTLHDEYGLTAEEVEAVVRGQGSRKIEEELARGRKRLEVRIDRLEKIFTQTCKDFEKNPRGTVDELKRAENNVEKSLKGG
ncbi:MAG TPA: hypothetical protein VKJ45_23890 [Blastocatellia bacterium]|nr:hypothetical protein [Blastocatellia bacterium]